MRAHQGGGLEQSWAQQDSLTCSFGGWSGKVVWMLPVSALLQMHMCELMCLSPARLCLTQGSDTDWMPT